MNTHNYHGGPTSTPTIAVKYYVELSKQPYITQSVCEKSRSNFIITVNGKWKISGKPEDF
jgi:hypothetical protein